MARLTQKTANEDNPFAKSKAQKQDNYMNNKINFLEGMPMDPKAWEDMYHILPLNGKSFVICE